MPSTVIAHIDYFPVTATLRIRFVSGLVYDYKEVPLEIYHSFKSSGAKGVFFNTKIKGFYKAEKQPAMPNKN
jgi:hypothetical protein